MGLFVPKLSAYRTRSLNVTLGHRSFVAGGHEIMERGTGSRCERNEWAAPNENRPTAKRKQPLPNGGATRQRHPTAGQRTRCDAVFT